MKKIPMMLTMGMHTPSQGIGALKSIGIFVTTQTPVLVRNMINMTLSAAKILFLSVSVNRYTGRKYV